MTEVKPVKLPRATLEQKIKILDFYHQSDKPQLETVEAFKDEVAISTLTFNEWVKKEEEYRQQYRELEGRFQKNSRRKTKFKYEKINRAMDLLVKQRLERGQPVTEPILRDYWQVYAHQFGVENPKRLCLFSHGWLSQFKKRHGICKPKRTALDEGKREGPSTADTTSFNKKLLTHAVSEPAQPVPPKNSEPSNKYASEPIGMFRPQKSLNFSLPYPTLGDNDERTPSPQGSEIAGTITPNLFDSAAIAKNHISQGVSSGDFERLLQTVADPFFQKNQYDYPQTMKLYQEFKSSFISERLISIRSAQDEYIKVQNTQSHPTTNHLQSSNRLQQTDLHELANHIQAPNHRQTNPSIGESVILDRSISNFAQSEMGSNEFQDPQRTNMEHTFNASVPLGISGNENNRDIQLERQLLERKQLGRQQEEEYAHRRGREKAIDIAHTLVSARRQNRLLPAEPPQPEFEEQALRNSRDLITQQEIDNQRMLRRQIYENYRQNRVHQVTGSGSRREQRERTHPQSELQSRLSLHKLPRLALTEPIGSPTLMRVASSPALPAALSIAAPFSNSRDERGGLDEIFARPVPSKTVSYNDDQQWSNKSELRKMWEQNKIMLS